MTKIDSTQPERDHHNGWFHVPDGTYVTIKDNKQMLCFGDFTVEGVVVIEGHLIQEP